MEKYQYRTLLTLPAHVDSLEALDAVIERGYVFLGEKVISGVAAWELEIIETIYKDDNGRICGYHKERNDPPPAPHRTKTKVKELPFNPLGPLQD